MIQRPPLKLYQFPTSHYCEKARWAMDYKKAAYEAINLAPGLHRILIKRKAPAAKAPITVPVLVAGTEVIQGSGEIIDYIDRAIPEKPLGFTEQRLQKDCAELEVFLDETIAKPLRAIAYHILLKDHKHLIAIWSKDCPFYTRAWLTLAMPYLARLLQRMYQTDAACVAGHKKRFNLGMDRLDKLCESRPFLIGDRFSRTDLTMAAFLAPLTASDQRLLTDEFRHFCEEFTQRATLKRALTLYQNYRNRP